MSPFAENIRSVLPELLLVAAAALQFLVGPFLVTEGKTSTGRLSRFWSVYSLAALLAALYVWHWYPAPGSSATSVNLLTSDSFSLFIRGLAIVSGLVLVLINWGEIADDYAAEFHGLIVLMLAGVSLTAAANDLIVLFLSLELVSIPTYVFLYLPRREKNSPEATTKYFLLSIFSSAIMLYGFSFLYGAVGTTQLGAIHAALSKESAALTPTILLIAIACIVAGLSFRVTAVPFHFYAPDVFQGSHAGAGALLAFVPKIVGFVALLRIVPLLGFLHFEVDLRPVLGAFGGRAPTHLVGPTAADSLRLWSATVFWLMAVLSMFVGNVVALLQQDVKRLLAYSSIAHAGYMLVGLSVAHRPTAIGGVAALLFYLVIYAATIAGVFGLLVFLRRENRPVRMIDDLAGLSQTHPVAAAALAILLFSLTGLPPTAGFLGKLNLLLAAWSQGTTAANILAIVLALNAAIAAAYYLRIVGIMYLRPPASAVETTNRLPAAFGIAMCVVVSVGLFFFPNLLWELVNQFSV